MVERELMDLAYRLERAATAADARLHSDYEGGFVDLSTAEYFTLVGAREAYLAAAKLVNEMLPADARALIYE